MNAIHTIWTAPFFAKNNGAYFIEDFEILTTILSAMQWRKHNGKIKLVADKCAIEFYKDTGLIGIWDEVEELEIDDNINPKMFWAASKLYALKKEKTPVVILDTDFIVWESIDFDKTSNCAVIHFEDLYEDIYPQKEHFKMRDTYIWKDFDWHLKAANTAFCVFKNQELVNKYTDEAIDFIKNAKDCDDYLTYMVFCEQRLLPMCAKDGGFKIEAISGQNKLFSGDNKSFTHIWGMKQQMRDNDILREDFCKRCINRIIKEFGGLEDTIKRIDVLKKYF